jgi:hypothetical protein
MQDIKRADLLDWKVLEAVIPGAVQIGGFHHPLLAFRALSPFVYVKYIFIASPHKCVSVSRIFPLPICFHRNLGAALAHDGA